MSIPPPRFAPYLGGRKGKQTLSYHTTCGKTYEGPERKINKLVAMHKKVCSSCHKAPVDSMEVRVTPHHKSGDSHAIRRSLDIIDRLNLVTDKVASNKEEVAYGYGFSDFVHHDMFTNSGHWESEKTAQDRMEILHEAYVAEAGYMSDA
jgi:hypothetical protein